MNFDQTLLIDDYIAALEAPEAEGTPPEAVAKIQAELALTLEKKSEGIPKVRLAFRRNGVNRQWLK